MRSLRKLTVLAAFMTAALSVAPGIASAASGNGMPSLNGSGSTTLSSLPTFVQGEDGNGNPLDTSNAGDLVFNTFGSTSPVVVVDEQGNAPTCGELTRVVVGTGTIQETAIVFDTRSVTNVTAALLPTAVQMKLGPNCLRLTTGMNTCTYNAQFHNGLTVMESSSTGFTSVYWRPCGGRR